MSTPNASALKPSASRKWLTAVVAAALVGGIAPVALGTQPASAFPKDHSVIGFDYIIDATTYIKKANQTQTVKNGTFHGAVDFDTARLEGSIKLPDAHSTISAGPLGLVELTVRTIPTAKVTGKVNLNNFKVTSTSKFLLKIVSMYVIPPVALPLPLPKVNLVGNGCQTVVPVVVTMSGKAAIGAKSTFKGTFSIPEFANCQGIEHALNQLIPGPGNTFTAAARPAP